MAWVLVTRDFAAEAQAAAMGAQPAVAHPLLVADAEAAAAAPPSGLPSEAVAPAEVSTPRADPLSAALAELSFDPLGASLGGLRPGAGPLDNPIGVSERSSSNRPRDARRQPGAQSHGGASYVLLVCLTLARRTRRW
jgi:hypothetical protein